jgi:hypothetical protein
VSGVHTQLAIPARSRTWFNSDSGGCPDPDGNLDGTDSPITQFDSSCARRPTSRVPASRTRTWTAAALQAARRVPSAPPRGRAAW